MMYCPSVMAFTSIAGYWVFLYTRSNLLGFHVWEENILEEIE